MQALNDGTASQALLQVSKLRGPDRALDADVDSAASGVLI